MRTSSYLSHLALYLVIWALVAVIFAAGAGFLLAALWFILREFLTPALAALSTGAAALAGGILIIVVGHAVRHRRSRGGSLASLIEGAESGRGHDVAAEIGALVGREAAYLISAHTGRAAVAAVALGFVVGANPRLRGVLREILK